MKAQIQITLTDKANYNVSLYKLNHNLKTKAQAINEILEKVKP